MEEPVSLRHTLASEDWLTLANLLLSLDTGVNGRNDARKLKKKIGVIRNVLYAYLTDERKKDRINISFLVGSIKMTENLEKEFDAHGISEREFIIFLRMLIYKLEKQKVFAEKPMERRIEIGKLKGAVENVVDL
jgi:hypothetical protein